MPEKSSSADSYGHVVQCDIDDELETILTIRKNDTWFHATANPGSINNSKLLKDYKQHATAAREYQQHMQRLISGEDQPKTKKKSKKNGGKKTQDSGYSSTQDDEDDEQEDEDADELAEDDDELQKNDERDDTEDNDSEEKDAEEQFQEWLQQPLLEHYSKAKPFQDATTVSEWYQTQVQTLEFYGDDKSDSLKVRVRDDLDGPRFVDESVTPHMAIPKYIKEMDGLEWFSPADVQVLEVAHNIHLPIHPTLVSVKKDGKDHECFIKLASAGDESAVKREIKFLHDMSKADLFNKGVRAPRLEGVVTTPANPDSHEEILGFLLSLIPQPCTPMTDMMDKPDIPQKKRDVWAKEMDEMLSLLHEHKLIWGDAKGDNFVVDKNDNLWIIDFGGSFTVGWIEPRYAGTKKGDRQGLEKIIDGIKNPRGDSEDAGEEQQASKDEKSEAEGGPSGSNKKRKRSSADAAEDKPSKLSKT